MRRYFHHYHSYRRKKNYEDTRKGSTIPTRLYTYHVLYSVQETKKKHTYLNKV